MTITNHGDSIASYKLVNNVSVSIQPFAGNDQSQFTASATYSTESADLKFSKKTVKISPGKTIQVKVSVIPPKTNPAEYIMYGGYIQLKTTITTTKQGNSKYNNTNKDITIPYIGIVGNPREVPVFGNNTPLLSNATGTGAYAFGPKETYVYDRVKDTIVLPVFAAYLNIPVKALKFPLYNEAGKEIGHAFSDNELLSRSIGGVTPSLTMRWNGTYLPTVFDIESPFAINLLPGKYHVGMSALKWLGDPENENDWETWKSGPIQLK